MATHSSVLAWRIPGTEEPSGLLSMGSHRVGHDWSDLAAAAGHFIESIVQILYVFTNFHSSINKERGVLKLPTITVDLSFFSLSSTSFCFIYFDTVIKWIRIWDVCSLLMNWTLYYYKFFLFFIENIPCLEIYFDAYTVISVFLSLGFIWYIFPSPLLLIYYFSIQFL